MEAFAPSSGLGAACAGAVGCTGGAGCWAVTGEMDASTIETAASYDGGAPSRSTGSQGKARQSLCTHEDRHVEMM